MLMLGDVLAAARDNAAGFDAWLAAADPERADEVRQAAVASGLSATAFVRMSIADFSGYATEEDWATLISSMRECDDPGTTCLLAMVNWRLSVPACSGHQSPANERTSHEPASERANS